MWINAREAARRLGSVGVGREPARRLLALGFAGAPVRTSSALLYDEARVEALADRPYVEEADLRRHCQYIDHIGHFPSVATVSGFIALGANIVGVREDPTRPGYPAFRVRHPTTLSLAEPGGWFDDFRGRRLPTGPGRPWTIRR
jgi:hypothetical protein